MHGQSPSECVGTSYAERYSIKITNVYKELEVGKEIKKWNLSSHFSAKCLKLKCKIGLRAKSKYIKDANMGQDTAMSHDK